MRKPIPGYEGRYEASDTGEIFSLLSGKALRAWRDPDSWANRHFRVALHRDRRQRTYTVHQLVAMAFLPPKPSSAHEIRHINGDHTDNRAANLEWSTKSQNTLDMVRDGVHNNARKTHCKNGHEFTAENTVTRKTGGRTCRTCLRKAQSEWKARKKRG